MANALYPTAVWKTTCRQKSTLLWPAWTSICDSASMPACRQATRSTLPGSSHRQGQPTADQSHRRDQHPECRNQPVLHLLMYTIQAATCPRRQRHLLPETPPPISNECCHKEVSPT